MRLLYFIKPHVMEDYLMSKYASVLELIGNTPVVRLSRLFPDHDVWLKLERANPGGSVKDRIALQMVLDAVARGDLRKKWAALRFDSIGLHGRPGAFQNP